MRHKVLDLLRSPAPRWLRLASLTLIHSAAALALLLVAALIPVAGWHRLYLQRRGWWLIPTVYASTAVAITVFYWIPVAPRPWMLLAVASPLVVLWIAECHLILLAAPALARKQIAIDQHEVVEA